tara:strand:- start:217 stop:564 length:348 start_codon:yes stop_codon:yes gene_type:complete
MNPEELYNKAHAAGMEALTNATPEPMLIVDSRNKEHIVVKSGVCGFAYVHIHPARGKFVNFLKKRKIGYRSHEGGYSVPCHQGNQSMELKQAYSQAFAKVLKEQGLTVYTSSRMD